MLFILYLQLLWLDFFKTQLLLLLLLMLSLSCSWRCFLRHVVSKKSSLIIILNIDRKWLDLEVKLWFGFGQQHYKDSVFVSSFIVLQSIFGVPISVILLFSWCIWLFKDWLKTVEGERWEIWFNLTVYSLNMAAVRRLVFLSVVCVVVHLSAAAIDPNDCKCLLVSFVSIEL